MSHFNTTSDYSLVSTILPKRTGGPVLKSLNKNGVRHILQSTSRGTLLNEGGGFFQKMFPPPAPEQELIQFLVPASKVVKTMEDAVAAGHLNHAGAGAIFAMPCMGDVQYTSDFPLLLSSDGDPQQKEEASDDFFVVDPLTADMEAIICIVEIGTGESMSDAALKSGSPGPTITYGEGGGVRDKIRLLRLTKGPEKEIVIAVVDKGESDKIFTEMARAGRINEPGRGFMYTTPVNKGLINVSSTFSSQLAGATIDQIVTALDEIKGGKEWRVGAVSSDASSKGVGKPKLLTDLTPLVGLFCNVHRDHYQHIYDAILSAGAGGVSGIFGILRDPEQAADAANEEWASVQTSIAPQALDKVRDAIKETIQKNNIQRACLFAHEIGKAATYLP
jgi:nitrogen regulatory protein PII